LTLSESAADEVDGEEPETEFSVAEDPPFSNQYCGGWDEDPVVESGGEEGNISSSCMSSMTWPKC
jgi:hypothetical protein